MVGAPSVRLWTTDFGLYYFLINGSRLIDSISILAHNALWYTVDVQLIHHA